MLVIAGVGHVKGTRELVPADGRPPTLAALIEADRPGEVAVVLPSGTTPASDAAVSERLNLGPTPTLHRLGGSWLDAATPCTLGNDHGDACASGVSLDALADAFLHLPASPTARRRPSGVLPRSRRQRGHLPRPTRRSARSAHDRFRSRVRPRPPPDATTIAYRRNVDPGADDADIWVMAVDGSGQRNLTNAPALTNWAPAWTPDGRIAFSSTRAGGTALELWIMDADGTGATRWRRDGASTRRRHPMARASCAPSPWAAPTTWPSSHWTARGCG